MGQVRKEAGGRKGRRKRMGRARLGAGCQEEGWLGCRKKYRVCWEGMPRGTGQAVEGRGGRTDANPFRYLQYTERKEQTKRRVVISVEGDGSVKCGCGVLPRYQIDGGNIHTEIGWV